MIFLWGGKYFLSIGTGCSYKYKSMSDLFVIFLWSLIFMPPSHLLLTLLDILISKRIGNIEYGNIYQNYPASSWIPKVFIYCRKDQDPTVWKLQVRLTKRRFTDMWITLFLTTYLFTLLGSTLHFMLSRSASKLSYCLPLHGCMLYSDGEVK